MYFAKYKDLRKKTSITMETDQEELSSKVHNKPSRNFLRLQCNLLKVTFRIVE